MTRRLSVDEAVGLLEGELGSGQRALDDLVTEDLWLAFLRFGRRLFDVSDTPDADGLLFQYGTHAFDGPPAFTLGLTRQFVITETNGDHDHYVQVHCELRYGLAPALEDLGSFDSWFFHDAGDDLEEWAKTVSYVVMRRWSVHGAGYVELDCSGRVVGDREAADPAVEGAAAGRRNAGHS